MNEPQWHTRMPAWKRRKQERNEQDQQEDNTKQTVQKLLTEWESNGKVVRVFLYPIPGVIVCVAVCRFYQIGMQLAE